MEQLFNNNPENVLSIVKSIIYHLNKTNFNNMVKKIIVLPVKTVELLEKIADFIHTQALAKQNYTVLYAQLCACMINHSNFNKFENSKITFQKLLVQKCFNVFSSYKTYQLDLEKLIKTYKQHDQRLSFFITTLCKFQFNYNTRVLSNIKFICELFKQEALPKKIILISITELSEKKDDLHNIYYLCVILKLVGQKLSKTHNLDDIIKLILSLKNENSKAMSSTLNKLILYLKSLHSNDWKNEELVQVDEKNYLSYKELPMHLKKEYELKSYYIMAESIFKDCHDALLKFSTKKEVNEVVHLLTNTWILNDHISFVVSIILVAINNDQVIRCDAGKLLDYLVMEKFLSKHLVTTGVSKVLNDYDMNINFPNLSYLISDIIDEFKF